MPEQFEFIVQGQDVYKQGFSREAKTRIRKQAMKKTAAERRKTNEHGKRNLRQLPVADDEPIVDPLPASTPLQLRFANAARAVGGVGSDAVVLAASPWSRPIEAGLPDDHADLQRYKPSVRPAPYSTTLRRQTWRKGQVYSSTEPAEAPFGIRITLPMPLSGLERMVADYGVNPIHFSSLTNIQVGRIAANLLSTEPQRLQKLLGSSSWSYFDFVPARIGHHLFLDDALRCLMFKTRALLTNDGLACRAEGGRQRAEDVEKRILFHYGRALRGLQDAVQDPSLAQSPDVLGATGILSVFEIISSKDSTAWSAHMMGAARLLQHRGPQNIKSDYEKALLVALYGPILCEALLNAEHSFLEEPEWEAALIASAGTENDYSPHSPIGVYLTLRLGRMVGLFTDVTHAICQGDKLSATELASLVRRGTELRQDLARCCAALEAVDSDSDGSDFDLGSDDSSTSDAHAVARIETYALALTISVLTNRLLGAVAPALRNRLEDENVALAGRLTAMDEPTAMARVSFYLAQKSRPAEAVRRTSLLWRDSPVANCPDDGGRVIAKWKFDAWCAAFGRRTCDGVSCRSVAPLD